ncbi:MAG: glycosyltransferase [Sandaracinobacter sp.]
MPRPRVIFLGNAIEADVLAERRIVTDSPAGSRKVFMMLAALRRNGVSAVALSMGRGRADGKPGFWPWRIGRSRGCVAIYMPFSHRPYLSELLTLVSAPLAVWSLRHRSKSTTLLAYNREPAHLLAVALARLLGFRVMLDFEDGEVLRTSALRRWTTRWMDALCRDGALLANTELAQWTRIRPVQPYYGLIEDFREGPALDERPLRILFGGTLTAPWGADMLAECLLRMKQCGENWTQDVSLDVTGSGDRLPRLRKIGALPGHPEVRVHGRVSDETYAQLLHGAHVGLQLRPVGGIVADNTFPSKLPEYVGAGKLLVTTDISDVRLLIGDGALYVEPDTADRLFDLLKSLVENSEGAAAMRSRGQERLTQACDPGEAVDSLKRFLFH